MGRAEIQCLKLVDRNRVADSYRAMGRVAETVVDGKVTAGRKVEG